MSTDASEQRRLSRIVAAGLIDAASALLDVSITRPEFGSAANVSGVRTKQFTFSRRNDSRTIFASNARYGPSGRAGAWTGSDRAPAAACRRILRAARVPAKEIGSIDVLSEMGQAAERVSEKEARVGEPILLRKIARAARVANGLPVWSSYATVGLTADGDVGWLELHWPDLPGAVIEEASVLQRLANGRMAPPTVVGARAEAMEAGIIHSPAIGFFMDVAAALRVVYRGDDPTLGRKHTLYLDRHGEPVPRPRDIEPAAHDSAARREPPRMPEVR